MAERKREPEDRRGRSRKKKIVKRTVWDLLLVICLATALFSGYKVADKLLDYYKADKSYQNLIDDVIETLPQSVTPAATEGETAAGHPEEENTSVETAEQSGQLTGAAEPESTAVAVTEAASSGESATTAAPTKADDGSYSLLSVNFDKLKAINPDVVGWLQGQSGNLSLPVVQGTDNSYYLTHLYSGQESTSGSLFVDCSNSLLQDDMTFIYGHHMANGGMFGRLDSYDSSTYFRIHPVFTFYTPEKTWTLRIFAVLYTDTSLQLVRNFGSEETFHTLMDKYLSLAIQKDTSVTLDYGARYVCLYTCAYQTENGRYLIFCKAE